jgi:hypothetical protein
LGNCKYCGKSAGFFRNKHTECDKQHQQREIIIQGGRQQITAEVLQAIKGSKNFDDLDKTIAEIEQSCFVPPADRKALLIKGWEDAVEQFLEDGILDAIEEKRLSDFKERFSLSQNDLDRNGALTKTAKAAVLRDILNGVIPQRMSFNEKLPINFQKGEQIVWVFSDSKYLEEKTCRRYVGGSQGVSVRVMKGIYYRVGAFKGHAVEHTERVHIDNGWVVVTNKNIYFAGSRKSVRLPYEKIVTFEPFSDGIGVMRDNATAKPQIFVTGDGWFTYNLITNLSNICNGTLISANIHDNKNGICEDNNIDRMKSLVKKEANEALDNIIENIKNDGLKFIFPGIYYRCKSHFIDNNIKIAGEIRITTNKIVFASDESSQTIFEMRYEELKNISETISSNITDPMEIQLIIAPQNRKYIFNIHNLSVALNCLAYLELAIKKYLGNEEYQNKEKECCQTGSTLEMNTKLSDEDVFLIRSAKIAFLLGKISPEILSADEEIGDNYDLALSLLLKRGFIEQPSKSNKWRWIINSDKILFFLRTIFPDTDWVQEKEECNEK